MTNAWELKLTELTSEAISLAYAKAVESGRRDGKGGLSPRTVHHMHRVLAKALKQAIKWRLLVRNPCNELDKTDRPKVVKKTVSTIDPASTVQVIEAARPLRQPIPLLLGSIGGLRRGEIAGLRPREVKFDQGHIAIIRSVSQAKKSCHEKLTKSDRCRTVAMYGIEDSAVGLAAQILDHDIRSYELIARVFAGQEEGLTRDDILDNITLYWLTRTGVSSARLYWENKLAFFAPKQVAIPVAVSVFPDDICPAPRSWAEKAYPKLIHYNKVDKGGHFAAWEQPQLLAQEVRTGFRPLRKSS